jgi:hypothetical protein
MKSDGIKRSVRNNRHDRATGDAPNMGRVARMPGTGMPKGERRTRQRSEGGRSNKIREGRRQIIVIWSVLLCIALVGTLGSVFFLWLRPKIGAASANKSVQKVVDLPATSRVASKFPSPSEGNALAIVRHALAIRNPVEIGNYFRPAGTSPVEIVELLKALQARDGAVGRMEWLSSLDANGLSLDGVLVGFKGGDKPKNRLALLTPDEEGKWKIDFDAFARTVTPPWNEFLQSRVEFALVRVYVAKDSYYNGPFADDKEWICYGIASPDMDDVLMAYCKIGTPQAAAMEWMLSKDSRMVRATLEIRRVAGAEPRQFEVSQVLAQDWVMGPAPFDQGFK